MKNTKAIDQVTNLKRDNSTPHKAVIYLKASHPMRTVNDQRNQELAITMQRQMCMRRAEQLNTAVVAEFIDQGSSATTERPALIAILDRLSHDEISYVIVAGLDRLSADRQKTALLRCKFERHEALLISCADSAPDISTG